MTFINNWFAITFLITIIFYIIVFECHECKSKPLVCNYSFNYMDIIHVKNGSLFINNIHIHHWILGTIILFFFYFQPNTITKSTITGISVAAIIDGLCFADRFNLKANLPDTMKSLQD